MNAGIGCVWLHNNDHLTVPSFIISLSFTEFWFLVF